MLPGDQINVLLTQGGVGSWGLLDSTRPSSPLEILHLTFVLQSCRPREKGPQVPPLPRLGISTNRVETVLP